MFYTKEIKLHAYQRVEDEWGIIQPAKYVYIKSIKADVQPYSQDKLNREYGYDLETTKRIFVDKDIAIKESTLITYKGKPYNIVKIIEWDDYLDIALNDAVGIDLDE